MKQYKQPKVYCRCWQPATDFFLLTIGNILRTRRRVAINDYLIDELIADPNFVVHEGGTIWRLVRGVWQQTGKAKTKKNEKIYNHLKFKGRMLLVHRIVYRKFNGLLDPDMVVNHIDGNSLNNHPSNLELVTQSINIYHSKPGWAEGQV